jgi:probable rRNA maturation factor
LGVVELNFYDHQDEVRLEVGRIEAVVRAALPLVLAMEGGGEAVLGGLGEVEINFVDDGTIARVHGEFLNDATPTDVITFEHGEILVGAETGARVAAEMGHEVSRECALYAIHGLLHLQGYDDRVPEDFAEMKRVQERILESVWPGGGGA